MCGTHSSHASSVKYAVGVQTTQEPTGRLCGCLLKSPRKEVGIWFLTFPEHKNITGPSPPPAEPIRITLQR